MDDIERPIWFLGNLDDPWVVALLAAAGEFSLVRAIPCRGDLPERLFEPEGPPRVVILHRSRITAVDVSRLDRWRPGLRSNPLPQIILCVDGYVRYAELERCSRMVDLVLPEATAVETLPRHVRRLVNDEPETPRHADPGAPGVEVVSSDHELRLILAETCVAAGFQVRSASDFRDARGFAGPVGNGPVITVWDVPVLDPAWTQRLEERCKLGPVVALMGFADRATVSEARRHGASACLDAPVDPHDLIDALNRVGRAVPVGTVRSPALRQPERACAPGTSGAREPGKSWQGGDPRTGAPRRWPDRERAHRITVVSSRPDSSISGDPMPRAFTKPPVAAPRNPAAPGAGLELRDLTRQIQRASGFPEALAALKNGRAATIDGAWGSAAGLVTAALGLHAPTSLVIVLAHMGDVDDFRDDVAVFSGITPEVFPAWEKLPREQDATDEISGRRLRVVNRLAGALPPRLIVTSIQALLQPVPKRDVLLRMTRRIAVGDTLSLDELSGWLMERGMQRAEVVEVPGEFSLRGGIFDVFPTDSPDPVRIEFFGDEVESIRPFDPGSQRSLDRWNHVTLTVPPSLRRAEPRRLRPADQQLPRGDLGGPRRAHRPA